MNKQELICELNSQKDKPTVNYFTLEKREGYQEGMRIAKFIAEKLDEPQNDDQLHDIKNQIEYLLEHGPGKIKSLRMLENMVDNMITDSWSSTSIQTEKVKVPAFVAEWISKCRELNWILPDLLAPEAFESSFARNTEEWLRQDKQNYDILARAWLDGYEVEEEPKYYIQLPGTTWGTYLVKSDDNDLLVWQNTREGTPFTEQEIKSIDERYWPFAVPVKKV